MNAPFNLTLLAVSAIALSACGGSGGGGNTIQPYGQDKKLGLSIDPSKKIYDIKYSLVFNGRELVDEVSKQKISMNLARLPEGLSRGSFSETQEISGKVSGKTLHTKDSASGIGAAYNQFYSAILLQKADHLIENGQEQNPPPKTIREYVAGQFTTAADLPTSGTVSYTGTAFDTSGKDGTFTYDVDFSDSNNITGSGTVNWDGKTLSLEQANRYDLPDSPFDGPTAESKNGSQAFFGTVAPNAEGYEGYTLALFGPQAKEIAGIVSSADETKKIGLAGKRK